MKECVDSGLHLFRFSVIGYDQKTYHNITGFNKFDLIRRNCYEMLNYSNSSIVMSYHLILKDVNEVNLYRQNFIDEIGCSAEIWKMHNWSGMLNVNIRSGEKKTCGRPFAPEITIRAGGINSHTLAIAPCCQTLGRDEDAILSHCDDISILEAYNSNKYNWLRQMHKEKRFDEISFCKDCDFLYDDESVLVWSNIPQKQQNKMIGLDFLLERK